MKRGLITSLLALLLSVPAAASELLDQYINSRTGSFSTAAQAAADSRYSLVRWHLAERSVDGDERRWLYVEAWMDEAEAPYMQRLISHRLAEDGSITALPHRLPDPESAVGAWSDPERLASIDLAALEPISGCETDIVRTGPDRFEARTRAAACRSERAGAAYAVSQAVIEADRFTNWDRGFATDGSLAWGPAAGGYQFRRIDDDSPACERPVRLLVFGTVQDRQAFGAYARALMASGLYERTGGYWLAASPVLEVFEGEPAPGRGVVISHFPCIEAAREFWFDEQYQNEIIPLRQDVSEFEVLVLPGIPKPDWAD